MDLSRIKKPFHIVCTNCKKEIEIYPNDIEKRYQKAKKELLDIQTQIKLFNSEYREDYKTNEWIKKARKAYAHKQEEVAKLKQTRSMLCEESERQHFNAFKGIVKRNVGEETYMKWIAEAEDEIQYNDYDTAVQRYSKIMSKPNNNR